MITLYTGTPGSGKSLHLIKVILRNLRLGKDVICNFPIRFTDKEIKRGYDKRFFYKSNSEITVLFLLQHAISRGYIDKKRESQCMVVIDEAGGRFNARDFKQNDRMEWIDFFSQHRKLGYDFILVAQSDRMIDRQIRGFIEIVKTHRKINNFGPFVFWPMTTFVCIEQWYVAKERVGAEFFLYRKKYSDRYDSFKMFEGFKLSKAFIDKVNDKTLDVSVKAIFSNDND